MKTKEKGNRRNFFLCDVVWWQREFQQWLICSNFKAVLLVNAQITTLTFPHCPLAKWRPVHGDPVGGDDARNLGWDEIFVGNELRPSGPGRTQHPCQQQLGVQSVWFRPFALPAGGHIWSQLHQLPGEYWKCAFLNWLTKERERTRELGSMCVEVVSTDAN